MMPRLDRLLRLLLALTIAATPAVRAQSEPQAATPETTVGSALRSLASRSRVAFVGQVIHIERKGGVVEIVFRVEQTVLGTPGSSYTLREWAGLWPPGQRRYVAGQRALIFLHAATGSGLSSPVDGMEGVVPVVPQGGHAAPLLDVRRLDARIQRERSQPLPDASLAGIAVPDAAALVANWRHTSWREPTRYAVPSPPPMPPAALTSSRVSLPVSFATHPGSSIDVR